MEINITQFYKEAAPMDYSASIAEIGNNAGADTWRAACEDAPEYKLLDTPEKLEAMRKWARASGGWNAEEIAEMNLEALFIQLVAGDMREKGDLDWPAYYELSEHSTVSGSLFENEGSVYYILEG